MSDLLVPYVFSRYVLPGKISAALLTDIESINIYDRL